MFRPGDTLNHGAYRIERELGAGGFGVVYLAEELRLRRKVAIKTLLPDLMAREPGMAEAFYAEARLTAGLAHPNILPIHFVGEEERGDQRLPYIVMEYIEGGDLEAVLAQGRGDLSQRLRWMRQITDGLAYAHAQGVVHRDLKPRNIFLTRTNTAKIGDFGLAKALGAETQTVLKGLGTAAYIAPEQIQGRPADARADLYALGVMYYQILTGRLPYDAPGVSDTVAKIMAICYQHINAPVPSARAVNPDIPAELDALTQRLMAKTPAARPASAAEVIPILEAGLRPAGPPPPVTQTVEGLAPLASAPAPSERGTPPPERPHPQAPAPESPIAPTQAVVSPPKRVRWTWLAIPAVGLVLGVGAVVFWSTRGGDGPPAPPAPPAPEAEPQETARRQAEDERKKLQAEVETARKQVEELRLAKLRDEQQRQAEAKQAADARKTKEAQEAKARAEDAARKQAEEARQKAVAAKQADAERLRREEEARAAQLQESRRQADARKTKEAQEAKARAEDAARKQAEEARQKAVAAKQADAERLRREEEARAAQLQESRRQAETRKAAEVARAPEPAELQRQVTQRLLDNGVPGLTVAVAADRSVRLSGAVDSAQKRDQALKLASATPGVTQVHDRIGVTAGCREPAPPPRYVTGEKWTWRYDKGGEWTDLVVADGDVAKIKTANGDVLVYDKDRILKLVVRPKGEILTQPDHTAYVWLGKKTLDFPLQVGRNWQYPFFQGSRNYINKYSIVTCEAVTTPAAKLEAFKIEVEESYTGSTNKGVLHLWYAPQVKNYIKRQYVPSQWWSVDRHRDYELVKYVTE